MEILIREFNQLKAEMIACLEATSTSGFSHIQHYILFFSHPLFSFTDSIVILCQNGKFNSAQVLLRSLLEAHINIIYHQVADTERRLALSAKELQDSRFKVLSEIKDLIRLYPNQRDQDQSKLFNEIYLDSQIERVKREQLAIKRANNLSINEKPPGLRDKAIACDAGDVKNAEPGSFQRMYTLIYRQLSPAAHLDVEGLQYFVDKNDDSSLVFTDGDSGDHLIRNAIDICLAYMKDLFDSKILDGEPSATLRRVEQLLKEQLTSE
ncbi:MAG: DUF5677 domain-containing protein [Minisyncoccia bacterium]